MSIKIRSSRPSAHDHSESDQIPIVTVGISSGAVTESRLADAAVSTPKMVDGAVTLAKTTTPLRVGMYIGDETETVKTGNATESQIKDFAFYRDIDAALRISRFRVVSRLRSTVSGRTGTMTIYHDLGGTPDLTLYTYSTAYEVKTGTIDVSGLTVGRHTIEVKVTPSSGYGIYNEMIEFYGVQEAE